MKFLTTSSIIMILAFSSLFSGIDVDEVKEKLNLIQNTGNSGNDFWFTIPPCYEETTGDNFIKILVTSTMESNVVVEVPGNGFYKTRKTIANGVIEIAMKPVEAQAFLHQARTQSAPAAKVYKSAGIHVTSEQPVIVYVVVKYRATSDGFFAIPSKSFGKKYVNMVYQEPNFKLYYNYSGLASPFTGITAAYDNTIINFTMGGGPKGNDQIELNGGELLSTGQSTTINMNKGDVWVAGVNGVEQDLSGSLITGNKPFSIVSGVHCANFPVGNFWCDYSVNMELPIDNWGMNYFITPQMERGYNGIVRIFASEPNTTIKRNGITIGNLKDGGGSGFGDSYLEMRLWPKYDTSGDSITPKIAHISADKPIAVTYYNTGTQEDGLGGKSDPFMSQIPPIKAAVNNTLVSSPNALGGGDVFTENYLRITFPLVNNEIPDDLLFAELSTSGVVPQYFKIKEVFGADFDAFEIGYEGKSYASMKLTLGVEGSYSIKSDSSKFVTESFGFSPYESYGFPTSFNLNLQNSDDNSAPTITYLQQCDGDILIDDGLMTDLPDDADIRTNLSEIYMLESENYEFALEKNGKDFVPGETPSIKWELNVIDKAKPASALIYASDMAGNDTTVVVEYINTDIEASSSDISLQNPNLTEVTFQDTIRNLSSNNLIYLSRLELSKKNGGISIVSFEPNDWDIKMPILPNSEILVNLKFSNDNIDNRNVYTDSLYIGIGSEKDGDIVECQYYPIANYRVSADFPIYELESNNNFGEFTSEDKPKKLQETISNLSDIAPLYISRLEFKNGDKGFSLGGFTPFSWDLAKPIPPSSDVIVDIIFNPKSVEQGDSDTELIDSTGIGVSVMNANNELEELEFNYKTQQKAILKAKGTSSVTAEQTLAEYMTVKESNILILPQALADGFADLSIYNIEGLKVISADIQAQNSVAINTLKTGTYLVTLKSNTRLLTRKINITK